MHREVGLRIKLIILFSLLASPVVAENSHAKYCLGVTGYSPEIFDSFDFGAASACMHDLQIAENEEQRKKLKEFLQKKPWYRGKNWKWEEMAEYTCVKQHHTGYVVCHKPFKLN